MNGATTDTFEVTELENMLGDELECESSFHPGGSNGHSAVSPVTHLSILGCCGKRELLCGSSVEFIRETERYNWGRWHCEYCNATFTASEFLSWLIPI